MSVSRPHRPLASQHEASVTGLKVAIPRNGTAGHKILKTKAQWPLPFMKVDTTRQHDQHAPQNSQTTNSSSTIPYSAARQDVRYVPPPRIAASTSVPSSYLMNHRHQPPQEATPTQRTQYNIPNSVPFFVAPSSSTGPPRPQNKLPPNTSISSLVSAHGTPRLVTGGNAAGSGEKEGGYRNYTFAQKVQSLTLTMHGYETAYIHSVTGVLPKAQKRILKVAEFRGFNPTTNPRILEAYVAQGHRSGRPKGSKNKLKRGQSVEESRERDNHVEAKDGDQEAQQDREDDRGREEEEGSRQQSTEAQVDSSVQQFADIATQLAGVQQYLVQSSQVDKT